ncbi:MAG: citrate transporter [Oligoflexales bacterium]|nr:citrate transporter [Oligoflexales bacterium]
MLALLGFSMMMIFILVIITGRCSALVALILIPLLFAFIGGFNLEIKDMMIDGIERVAPTGIMLMFAILYFSIMIEAGLFNPIINIILKYTKNDPMRIVIGTTILSMITALDGDGTTTYMITVSAMLPLYIKLKMNPLILSSTAMLAFGVMNMTPWGGPMARAVTSLNVNMHDVFRPLIPVMGVGLLWTLFTAYILGKKEKMRLQSMGSGMSNDPFDRKHEGTAGPLHDHKIRKHLLWINFILTAVLIACLFMELMSLPALFMIAFAIALFINYPHVKDQRKILTSHAGNAITVVLLVFASGIFTGILSGTKMIDEMAKSLVFLIPASLGHHFPSITALSSLFFTYFLANDPYYYGVLPIIAKTASEYGIEPVQIARASILSMPLHVMSPLVASSYVLMGLVGVEFSKHQRFVFKWAAGSSIMMIIAAVTFGVISA